MDQQVMDEKMVLGNNDIDDVRWLCSLTESELDLLMSLKHMVNTRAQTLARMKSSEKYQTLAKHFNLRMLRELSFIYMEHLKGKLKDVQGPSAIIDSNLLKKTVSEPFCSMTIEELYPYVRSDKNKRKAETLLSEDMSPLQTSSRVKNEVI